MTRINDIRKAYFDEGCTISAIAAKRVHRRLEGAYPDFDCSYRTVASYVKEKKRAIYSDVRAAPPLEHKAGEARVDFGSADFYENGTLCSGKYLNVSFPYSNAGYLQLFKGENRECLFARATVR